MYGRVRDYLPGVRQALPVVSFRDEWDRASCPSGQAALHVMPMTVDDRCMSESEFMAGQKYTALTGAAGEYYVAAELSRRGWAASITPRGVERSDVLAQHLETKTVVAIQVKTMAKGSRFTLSAKNEEPTSATNEWFALVHLASANTFPGVYLVPRNLIAAYIYLDHRSWLSAPARNGQPRKDSSRRAARPEELRDYKDRWDLLIKPTHEVPFSLPTRLEESLGQFPLP
jgi:hypothetical protein